MDSGDNYDVIYLSSCDEEGGGHLNLNKQADDFTNNEAGQAVTTRNFSKK